MVGDARPGVQFDPFFEVHGFPVQKARLVRVAKGVNETDAFGFVEDFDAGVEREVFQKKRSGNVARDVHGDVGGVCRVSDIDDPRAVGVFRPEAGKGLLEDEGRVEDGVNMGVPLLAGVVPGDLEKPDSAGDGGFPFGFLAHLLEGADHGLDLMTERGVGGSEREREHFRRGVRERPSGDPLRDAGRLGLGARRTPPIVTEGADDFDLMGFLVAEEAGVRAAAFEIMKPVRRGVEDLFQQFMGRGKFNWVRVMVYETSIVGCGYREVGCFLCVK